jgi:hypothetical protein
LPVADEPSLSNDEGPAGVVVRLEVAITPAGLPTGADKIRIDGMFARARSASSDCRYLTLKSR